MRLFVTTHMFHVCNVNTLIIHLVIFKCAFITIKNSIRWIYIKLVKLIHLTFLIFLVDIHLFRMNNYLIMGSLEYQFKRTLIISSLSDVLKI